MLHVIVTMRIKEGRMLEFLAACEELRPQVLQEPGCLAYDYTGEILAPQGERNAAEADLIILVERWESLAALKAHNETAHMKAAAVKMKDLRSSVQVRLLEPIF